ncbi:MAG: phosphorylase, partial [Gemmatimonadota bacterium]
WLCLAEFDSLVFYNSGTIAGASQPHKHLQQVSIPVGAGPERTPIDAVIAPAELDKGIGAVPVMPFRHNIARLSDLAMTTPSNAALPTLQLYKTMLTELDCHPPADSYNLLATRDWMLMVPRSLEKFRSISVNSLGFAGSLLVRNEEELGMVREVGPLEILRQVAVVEHA